jgi:hypothetical protein
MQLDDGKKVALNEGDVVCQRGTAHSWRNESSEWARIYFVLLGEFFSLRPFTNFYSNRGVLQVQNRW